MAKLTAKQQQIYDYILSFTNEHGYPPSVREIGAAVGLKSPSTVHFHMKGLEEAAGRVGVKTQREVLTAGGNDAAAMQAARAGVLAGTISIACRYVQSACETISLADCEGAKKMLVAFLRQPGV